MPTDLPSMINALKSAMASGDRAAVNRACIALIDAASPLGPQWAPIAAALQHNGEHGAALRAIDTWRRQQPDSAAALFQQAAVLARAGRPAEARAILDQLPESVPDPAGNAYLKGTVSINLGDTGTALTELRRGAVAHPGSGQILLALAMAGPISLDDGRSLRDAQQRFGAAPDSVEKASYFYALGKLEDQHGANDQAFAAFARGAAIMHRLKPFDAAADDRVTDDNLRWTSADIDRFSATIETGDARPIFVTGLPRSGTTLVEQILASHSAVVGGEELGLFRLIGQDLGGLSRADWDRFIAGGGSPQQLRDLYHHLLAERFPQSGRVVDKSLVDSRQLGIIASLFPDAPIIWLRRDPADCAWSAFRTFFARSVDWSWSLESIAAFFNNEDRLFEHWTRELGTRILVVPYAELVADPAGWTDRITRHAGLDPEEAQRTPHLSDRAVTTASATQVREPINRKGLGSARPYREHLKPFFDRYRGYTPVSAG